MDSINSVGNNVNNIDYNMSPKKVSESGIYFADLLDEEQVNILDFEELVIEDVEELDRDDSELSYLVYPLINRPYVFEAPVENEVEEINLTMSGANINNALDREILVNIEENLKDSNLLNIEESNKELEPLNDKVIEKDLSLEEKIVSEFKDIVNKKEDIGPKDIELLEENKIENLDVKDQKPLENKVEYKGFNRDIVIDENKDEVENINISNLLENRLNHVNNNNVSRVDRDVGIDSHISTRNMEIVNDSIIDLIEVTKDGERNTMRVKLYPEELGDIELILDMQDSELNIKIMVENEVVQKMFLTNTEGLNQRILEQNINLSQLDIEFSFNQESNSAKEHGGKELFKKNFNKNILKEKTLINNIKEMNLSNLNILA